MVGYWTVADERFSTRQTGDVSIIRAARRSSTYDKRRGLETLEIMCNLIFTHKIKGGEDGGRGSATKGAREEWTAVSDRPIPEGFWAFSSQATQSHRAVPDSTHSSDTCINGILAWDCRCWKAIVPKQLCLSYSLSLALSYFTSVSFTDSSILS